MEYGAGENIERRGVSGEIRGKRVCVGERRPLPGAVAALLNRGPVASGGARAGWGYRVYFSIGRRGRGGRAHFHGFARIRLGDRLVRERCTPGYV